MFDTPTTPIDRAPHHDGSARYVPDQAPAPGSTVTVFLRVPAGAAADRVVARYVSDGEPRYAEAVVDRTVRGAAPWQAETWWRAEIPARNPITPYRFLLLGGAGAGPGGAGSGATGSGGTGSGGTGSGGTGSGGTGSGGYRWHNALGTFGHDVPDNHDFTLVSYDPPPAWARDAVIYQIFPDRFARSGTGDPSRGGTTGGTTGGRAVPDWAIPCDWDDTPVIGSGPETPYQFYGGDLDGVTAHLDHVAGLGANAVYLTPFFPARSNHRYDASTFDHVDPLLGGDEALIRLAEALHRRGMRLIGDVTTNHCGDGHDWFKAAVADPAAPEREMFYFGPDGGYESWWGFPHLPKLNWKSAALRRRFLGTDGAGGDAVPGDVTSGGAADPGVIRRWLSILDGWRVDVANMTGRTGAENQTAEVAELVRKAATAARSDALVIAEHNHYASGDLDRNGWQGTMNYAGFTRPVWTWLGTGETGLPDFLGVPVAPPRLPGSTAVATMRSFGATMSWRSRSASWTLLGSHDTPRIRTIVGSADLVAVAAGLLLTMPGSPMLYAGDEWGLTGTNGEDGRRPMPWNRPDRRDPRTEKVFRELTALRHRLPALRHGGLRWAYADDDSMVLLRETAEQAVIVLARRAAGDPVRVRGLGAVICPPTGSGTAPNVHGGADELRPDSDGAVTFDGDGPTFQVWLVDGR